jgi:hypothetical protein
MSAGDELEVTRDAGNRRNQRAHDQAAAKHGNSRNNSGMKCSRIRKPVAKKMTAAASVTSS